MVEGQTDLPTSQFASGNYFQALGVPAVLGRTIEPSDDVPGANGVVVISHAYWERQFKKSPTVIGAAIFINLMPFTIVGVAPETMQDVNGGGRAFDDISIPLSLEPSLFPDRSRLNIPWWWLTVMGRLKPEISKEQVQANFQVVFTRQAREEWQSHLSTLTPQQRQSPDIVRRTRLARLELAPASRGAFGAALPRTPLGRMLRVLAAIFVMILLIVCSNIAKRWKVSAPQRWWSVRKVQSDHRSLEFPLSRWMKMHLENEVGTMGSKSAWSPGNGRGVCPTAHPPILPDLPNACCMPIGAMLPKNPG